MNIHLKKYRVYLIVSGIMLLMVLFGLMINDSIPFGNNFPFSGNGFFQDFAQFINAINMIKSGKVFNLLDYSTGFTFDNYGMRSYSLSFFLLQPWLYLIYYIVPEAFYIHVFLLYYVISFVIPGPIFVYYLSHRRSGAVVKSDSPILIVVGLCYGMALCSISSYIYMFRFMIFIPVIFLGIERIVYDRSSKLYILAMAYYMALDAYYAFIMCVFSVFYFLILEHKTWRRFLRNLIRFAISSLTSACLSAAFLIPYFIRTRYSPYGSFDNSKPNILNLFGFILYPLADFRIGNPGIVVSSDEYRANIYCGILVLLLCPLYITLKDINIGHRIKFIILVLFIYFGFDNQLLNYIMHGFHYQWQVPNRFAAFFVFLLLYMFTDVILRFDDLRRKHIILSALYMSGILIFAYYTACNEESNIVSNFEEYKFSLIFVAIYVLIILLFGLKQKINLSRPILCMVLAIEVLVSSIPGMIHVFEAGDNQYELQYVNDIKQLAERHSDVKEPYVLIERPGEVYNQNIADMTGTHSLSFYTSSSYRQQFDLLFRWGILFSKNITYYNAGSPLADMILHVKYHVINLENNMAKSEYTPVDKENNTILCQNPYYLPLGIIMDEQLIGNWALKSETYRNFGSSFERDNEFAHSFGVSNLYDIFTVERVDDPGDNKTYYRAIEDSERNALYHLHVDDSINGKLYIQIAQALEFIGEVSEQNGHDIYFSVPYATNIGITDSLDIGILNEENFRSLYDILSEDTVKMLEYNSSSIVATTDSPKGGLLYMAMPDYPGFTAYIDGKEVDIVHIMDGIGIRVASGRHVVELKYLPEGVVVGWQISVITALFILIYKLLKIKKKMDNKEPKIEVKDEK